MNSFNRELETLSLLLLKCLRLHLIHKQDYMERECFCRYIFLMSLLKRISYSYCVSKIITWVYTKEKNI